MAELNEAESTKDTKKTKKEKKMEEKAAKKAAKKAKKNHEADKPDAENDDSDSVSSKIVMVLVTILIIAIWLGIFAVFVKADVGGFGSTVLAPALKDVPVLSKILPDSGNITASESKETAGYTNLDDAVSRIKELEKQLDDANSKNQADAQTINDLFDESGPEPVMDAAHNSHYAQPEEIVTQEELKTMLVKSLDNLTEKERRVIELYYYEDLTLKEISNILEVSESRVSQLHTKGLIKMRKVMGPYMNILTNA